MAKGRKRRGHGALKALVCLVLAAAVGFFAAGRLALLVTVRGGSMSPTLENGSIVLCLREDAPRMPAPQRGDVVLLSYEGALLVKRVIAVGGDAISLDESGAVTVNGEAIREDYITATDGRSDQVYPLTVPEGELFVMGDHRAFAVDSRSRIFGTVPVESVAGRPIAVIWPAYECAWLGWPGQRAAQGGAAADEVAE